MSDSFTQHSLKTGRDPFRCPALTVAVATPSAVVTGFRSLLSFARSFGLRYKSVSAHALLIVVDVLEGCRGFW